MNRFGDLRGAQAADGRLCVAPAKNHRRDEEGHFINEPRVEKGTSHFRAAFNNDALQRAAGQDLQRGCKIAPAVRRPYDLHAARFERGDFPRLSLLSGDYDHRRITCCSRKSGFRR